jgi:hypothetical protein
MVAPQDIGPFASVQDSPITFSAQFGNLSGHAFEAAVRFSDQPPGTTLSIASLRELLGVGTHIAGRVLRELTAAGLAVGKYVRDAVNGRLLGRHMLWTGPTIAGGLPEPPSSETVDDVGDQAGQAFSLLRSLGAVDPRLAFRERDLRTLVPFVVDRFEAGDTDADVLRLLTVDLPRKVKSGLLRHRLTKVPRPKSGDHDGTSARPSVRPGMVECVQCRAPGPLTPGDRCRGCREATTPQPLSDVSLDRLLPRQYAPGQGQSAPERRHFPPRGAS